MRTKPREAAPLARLTLIFDKPEREAAYRRAQFLSSLVSYRWALVFSILIHLVYLHVDTLVLGENASTMWYLRLHLAVPASALVLAMSFHHVFGEIDHHASAALVLLNGLLMTASPVYFGAYTTMYFVPGTVMVGMYGYLLLGLRFSWAAPLVWAIVVLQLLVVWILPTSDALTANADQVLLISTAILTVGAYRFELVSRTEHYRTEQLLVQERREREAEAARIDWLENLAHFLRHELRNSVTGVRTSVDMLERRAGVDERTGVYFERARWGLQVIRRLLDSASQASSLESSFLQDRTGPLRLVPIVQDEVEGFQESYPGVLFRFHHEATDLWINGNRERVIQLLHKLLSNAVDHHDEGTPVTVSVTRAQEGVWLVVENLGPPLPPEGDAIFDLFASFRAQTDPDSKRGFGLYVVRLIAEQYGGAASAMSLESGSGARFEVRFPSIPPP